MIMKGDFSFLPFDTEPRYTSVLHQQGRVLLDRDWNEAAAIASAWRTAVGRDTFGPGWLSVPVSNPQAFKLISATTDGQQVKLQLDAGRAWADGLSLSLAAPSTFVASYFAPPFQSPQADPSSIADGVRDLVVLDVWEEAVSGFQDPLDLIEPALGGPDTTERTQAFANLRLLRLGPNDDCNAAADLADDFGAKGKLTVSPAPVLSITGDCPLEAGGGYTGLEHYLYRIEIADPDGAGQARFKWSQWNAGLVGRGLYAAGAPGTGSVNITANDQLINHCGVSDFYLEALAFDASLGNWAVTLTADATLAQDGVLALSNVQGAWPVITPSTGFFRLWNGIARIADFPLGGANPVELKDGIRLEFDAAAADNANYLPGDYWAFPVRASGVAFEPPVWPTHAPPQGVQHRRVALGILNWNGAPSLTITFADGEIDDCRHLFRPLTNQKVCCTFNVGDGRSSHGDFDSIEEAITHLPASGGEICLLPGLHTTNAVIHGRRNVQIKGCDTKTKLIPRQAASSLPIFTVTDSVNISLVHMDMAALSGTAIVVGAAKADGAVDVEIAHNRILAATHAIRARNARGMNIHHNRIRMIDKAGGDVAIYLAGDDSLIERNDIRLVPAISLPPITVPTEPDPVDPNDPCAKLELIYFHPRLFLAYVNLVWELKLPIFTLLTQPYRALSGIQLGGGSERVRVLENKVVGGAGNGITLGTSVPPVQPEADHVFTLPQEASVRGRVLGPDGKGRANVQITLTDTNTNQAQTLVSDAGGAFSWGSNAGSFRVTEGEPGLSIDSVDLRALEGRQEFVLTITLKTDEIVVAEESGFLYDIAIERNDISAMGLSGIGVVVSVGATGLTSAASFTSSRLSAFASARSQLAAPVVGLAILGNHIRGNLLDLFDRNVRAIAATQGLGGISLGLCARLAIVDNEISRNGSSAVVPVCGIFVAYGEDVEIARNRIVANGPLSPDITPDNLLAGQRGGIVLRLVTAFNLFDAQALAEGDRTSARPALRVHENLVDQPVGQALRAGVFGPVQCTDNAFSSELSGLSAQEHLSGVVFLFNLGGVNLAGAGVNLAAHSQALEQGTPAGTTTAPAPGPVGRAQLAADSIDAKASAAGTATPAPEASAAASAVLVELPPRSLAAIQLLPLGDVMFSANQSRSGAGNSSLSCQLIATFDDLAWQGNQSSGLNLSKLFTNGLLFGRTLRATGNRLRERNADTLLSLFSLGVLANDTSLNQADHCIVATDMNPALTEVKLGNQILNPGRLCAARSLVATNTFKPRG